MTGDDGRYWTGLEAVAKAAEEVLGYKKKTHKPWVSDQSRILSEEQRRLRVEAEDEPLPERREDLRARRRRALRDMHKSLEEDQNRYWTTIAEEVEEAGERGESQAMFAAVRVMKTLDPQQRSTGAGIKNREGVLVTSSTEKKEVFATYFEELLNPVQGLDEELHEELQEQEEEEGDDGGVITRNEVGKALKSMKNRKAAGVCEITTELLKEGGPTLELWLTQVFNKVWRAENVPEDWKKAVIVAIFKNKGSSQECSNYRGISLLSVPGKLFMRVLLNRIKPIIENKLREEQAGFRRGRSTIDQIYSIRRIIEKRWEYGLQTYCAFVDLQKAYDSVWRSAMWRVAKSYGIPSKIIRMLQNWYEGITNCVRVDGEESRWFEQKTGLRQGCVMSPSLFNIFMDKIMRMVTENSAGVTVGDTMVTDLDFADDVVLMADTWQVLAALVMKMEEVTQRVGINISQKKSEVMVVGREQEQLSVQNVELRGEGLKQTEEYIYLGSAITSDGRHVRDMERRRALAANAFGKMKQRLWGRREVSQKVKMKVFNAMVLPVLSYAASTWAMTRTEERKLDALEMRMIRTIMGIRWTDRVRNEDIRSRLHQVPISLKIRRARLQWLGHMERMEVDRIPKEVSRARMVGRRPRGRPRTRWDQVVERDLENAGVSLVEARGIAPDRQEWREVVSASCQYPLAGS